MELQLVMVVVQLIDICAFPFHNIPNLVVVEFDDRIAGSKTIQKSNWYRYTFSPSEKEWNICSKFTQTIPLCGVIKASSIQNEFCSVLQSNTDNALAVVTTVLDSDNIFRTKASASVDLSAKSWTAIEMPVGGSWSTPFLNMERCMFNPHILTIDENKSIVVANAVDASARLFIVSDNAKEIGKIDRCIEPCIIDVAGMKMVIFRRCPKNWLVFHNQPNTRLAPELLPLVAYTLDGKYSIVDTNYISKGWDTGSSFVFDVCSTNDNAIALATVTGILKRPQLQVLISYDKGNRWEERTVIQLEEVPLHVRVTAAGKRILIACTFKRHDGYHVMAAEFDR